MVSQLKRARHKILISVFLAVVALGLVQTATFAFQSAPTSAPSPENNKLRLAAVQHNLVLVLIDSKKFDQVESEWKKVLDLKLGAKYEGAIADSLVFIGYKLSEAKQFSLALKIMDQSLSIMPFSNKSKADIFMLKAHIYTELGDSENAIRAYQFARELLNK